MNNIAISVIVPVYNVEKYLNRCIDSILAQTFTDFELLLIDDGSKDASGEICDEYVAKDTRVRVFHKNNEGVSKARNLGLDNARGEWITFVDADDYIDKDFLYTYDSLKADVDVVVQSVYCIKDSCALTKIGFKEQLIFKSSIECIKHILAIHKGLLGYSVNKLYKAGIIRDFQVYYDERLMFREDEEFVLRYFTHVKKIICTPYAGYYYIMPSSEKYLCTDVYWAVVKSYKSIKTMSWHNNVLMTQFQIEATQELMSSFYARKYNDKFERLKYFCKVVSYRMLSWDSIKTISSKLLRFIVKKT